MGKALIITEKPSVARDVTEALGGFESIKDGAYYESDEYVCTYAVGHILSLFEPEDISSQYKRWRLADLPIIPEKFEMKPIHGQEGRLKIIGKLFKRDDVDRLINACDAAREGELIFREIVKYIDSEKPIQRLWLQSMTKKSIIEGFTKLADGAKYEGLAAAAECRAYSDWMIGMNATRAFTVRLKSKAQRGASWSAGRVQTPTLALLVERELKILQHVPEPYWKVDAKFKATDHDYEGHWIDPDFKKSDALPDHREDRIFDKEKAEKILKDVEGKAGVASEIRKPKTRNAPLLFDLTSAQKEANRRWGWSAKRTLGAAQRCYERHKVLTYPRTSSRVLPEDYREEVDKLINVLCITDAYGRHAKYLNENDRKNEKKIFNDAGVSDHFAIIPTGQLSKLEGDDQKLFDLVVRTFLAAFYPPAIFEEVERLTVVNEHTFKSKPPLLLKEPGWQAVFEKDTTEEQPRMPPLAAGQSKVDGVDINNTSLEMAEDETRPPSRISEGGLLSMMENAGRQVDDKELATALNKAEGLGTAATRADIIENLKYKEYVDRELRPTVKGIRLIDVLNRIKAHQLTSAALTAKLELHLTEVEAGTRSAANYLEEVASITQSVVDAARDFDYDQIYPNENVMGECPKCGREIFERAWFYGCTEATKRDGKKTCDFLIWKDFYGRYIDRQTVLTLLTKSETRELDGFRSPSGKMYKGVLAIENGSVVRKSTGAMESGAGFEVNEDPMGACPIHKDEKCQVVETPSEFLCEILKKAREEGDKDTAGFSFPRMLCKREITRDEAIAFIDGGETPVLQKFISKRGRPFAAKLKANPGGGFTFEFPAREPKKKKATKKVEADGDSTVSADADETVAKKTTKKAAKKTAKKVTKKKVKKAAPKAADFADASTEG